MTGSSGRGHAEKARCLLFALSFPGGDLSCEFADGMRRGKRATARKEGDGAEDAWLEVWKEVWKTVFLPETFSIEVR